jgi:predicted permease
VVAITSLALAIGANTAIFSLANEALIERLNVPNPKQLRLFTIRNSHNSVVNSTWGNWGVGDDGSTRIDVFSYPVFRTLQQRNSVMQPIFGFKNLGRGNLSTNNTATTGQVEMVSGNYYAQLQVQPALGRVIRESDDSLSAPNVAILSDGYWTRVWNRDPSAIGRTITINSVPFTIIGINPRGFTGAKSVQVSPEVFVPLAAVAVLRSPTRNGTPWLSTPDNWWVQVMARTQPSVADTTAQAALNTVLAGAVQDTMHPHKDQTVPILNIEDGSRGLNQIRRVLAKPLYILLGMTALLLLIACTNLANLMLARAATRQREMGIRMALGAGRARVMRQVLTENLLLALLGGIAGLVLGRLGSTVLPRLTMNAWEDTQLNIPFHWPIFLFTAAITMLTGVLFSIAPALQATRSDINSALKDTGRSSTRRSRGFNGKVLVGFQITLCTLLVGSAALFFQTLWKLNHIEPGFNPDYLVLFDILPPAHRYPAPQDIALHHRLEQAIAAVPGVDAVSTTDVALIADNMNITGFQVEGQPPRPAGDSLTIIDRNMSNNSRYSNVGNDYFHTMSIPIVAGRAFNDHDTETSKRVAVINRALVRQFFPDMNPIGKRFRTGDGKDEANRWIEVIGIANDIRYSSLRDDPPPLFFVPYRQQTDAGVLTYNVRSSLPTATLVPMLRRAIAQVDANLPLIDVRTQWEQIDASLQQEHLFASLTAGFGVLALLLAIVGIYGMMSYRVTQRTQEMGVRLALGATRTQVRGMAMREALWTGLGGVLAGGLAAALLLRVIKSTLYGAGAANALPITASALLLLLVTLASAWLPCNRIARLEPVDALRHE